MKEKEYSVLYFIIAVAFSYCAVRYLGIKIDGELYTLQVIHNWYPERFLGDVSFMYGNQDSFTIFSAFYGAFMKLFTVNIAAMLVCLVSQLAFALSLAFFIKEFFSNKLELKHILAVFLAFFIVYVAGSDKVELYFTQLVEAYPVPRTLSIAFGVAGLAMLFKEKKWASLVLIVVGCLFHPLMAGWALPIWMFNIFPKSLYPVVGMSVLLPFSSIMNLGPFKDYAEGWLTDPLLYAPNLEYCLRYLMYFYLAFIFLKKWNTDVRTKKILKTFVWTLGISCYWYLSTGVGRNIFIYQIQPWRIEWLSIVLLFPLLCSVLIEILIKFVKNRSLHSWDVGFACVALTVISDSQNFDGLLVSVFLFLMKNRQVSSKLLIVLGGVLAFANICISNLVDMFWSGLNVGGLLSYKWLSSAQMRYVVLTSLMSVFIGCYAFKQKQYVRLAISLAYIVFPQILLLPLINILYPILKRKYGIGLLLLAVLDFLFDSGTRATSVSFSAIEKKQLTLLFMAFVCAFPFFVHLKKKWNKVFYSLAFALVVPYAIAYYDQREETQKKAEQGVDQFKYETVFPKVQERGKMFFYVKGEMDGASRTQFLTGNYFDLGSNSGGVFLKQQYDEIRRRECLTVYKTENCEPSLDFSIRQIFVHDFIEKTLVQQDSLIDHIGFLCQHGEISYLVTTCANLPFAKKDSVNVGGIDEKLCLYTCTKEF